MTTTLDTAAALPQYTGALELFLNSIGSKETRSKYRNKLDTFLDFVGVTGTTLQEKAQYYADRASKDNQWAFGCIVGFITHHRQRWEQKEIPLAPCATTTSLCGFSARQMTSS